MVGAVQKFMHVLKYIEIPILILLSRVILTLLQRGYILQLNNVLRKVGVLIIFFVT